MAAKTVRVGIRADARPFIRGLLLAHYRITASRKRRIQILLELLWFEVRHG